MNLWNALSVVEGKNEKSVAENSHAHRGRGLHRSNHAECVSAVEDSCKRSI